MLLTPYHPLFTTPSYPPVTHTLPFFPLHHVIPLSPFPLYYVIPTISPSHTFPSTTTHPPLTLSLSIHTTHHQHNAVLDYMPFSTSISIGVPHRAMACQYLVSIDDIYEQDEMFHTIPTTDDETITITNDIAIATILDDDGELYVQQLTQTHKPSALIYEYIYKGTTPFSHTAWFSSCLVL